MAKKIEGTCPFCGLHKKLCESHILPKWLVRDRGDSGYFQITEGDPFRRRIPEGWKEYLLCMECDGELGVYDAYAADFFRSAPSWTSLIAAAPPQSPRIIKLWTVQNFDYVKLKLFFMSILWRAAVCTIEPFKEVYLEEQELRRLHQMLKEKQPGTAEDFTVSLYKREPNGLEKVTRSPDSFVRDGVLLFWIGLNEFVFEIKGSSDPYTKCEPFWLKPTPPLYIMEGETVQPRIDKMVSMAKEQQRRLEEFRKNQKQSDSKRS